MYPRFKASLFWSGLTTFFVFIGIAAARFPGGNRFDNTDPYFSFEGNYLCDLFHGVTYNGMTNEGRLYAYIGTYTLALTFLLFWNLLPNLFNGYIKHQRLVRFFGTSAMAVSLLIATPLHDWCILVAIPLGVIAFLVSIHALLKSGEKYLARLGIVSMAMCVINYFALILHPFPRILPGLQKITLFVFLLWVVSGMLRLRRVTGTISA